jgi:hypothetical protein
MQNGIWSNYGMSRTTNSTTTGFGRVFLWIFFGGIGLLILAYIYAELKKAYWDQQVKELCEKDGGVTVYQHVIVTPGEYERYGGGYGAITVPSDTSSIATQYPYVTKNREKVIRKVSPLVYRVTNTVYRKSDGSILGTLVTYYRSGGNFAFFQSPGFSCRDLGIRTDLENQIFIVQGEK